MASVIPLAVCVVLGISRVTTWCDMQNLTKLLGDYAPKSCKEQKIDSYFGRKVAIDASMHIYQFLVNRTGHLVMQREFCL